MRKGMFGGADKNIFERAKVLRKQQTGAEELLWLYLKQKPLGFKFRRQHPFGIYILDFYCHALQFAIEVDGSIHDVNEVKQNDEQREAVLKQLNINIVRFTNDDVMHNRHQVIQQIEAKIYELRRDEKERKHEPKFPAAARDRGCSHLLLRCLLRLVLRLFAGDKKAGRRIQ